MQQIDQLFQIAIVNVAWRAFVNHANTGGLADTFAHHAARLHHSRRAQCFVSHADVAAGHEQVFDVATVEASIGHRVAVAAVDGSVVFGDADERVFGELFGVLFLGIVQIN